MCRGAIAVLYKCAAPVANLKIIAAMRVDDRRNSIDVSMAIEGITLWYRLNRLKHA